MRGPISSRIYPPASMIESPVACAVRLLAFFIILVLSAALSAQTAAAPQAGSPPIAVVPLDAQDPSAAASVTGPISASNGRAYIVSSGEIAAGSQTVRVTLPYRGSLDVCAHSDIKLSADTSVPASSVPGLLIALQSGAIDANFAIVRNADIVQTPDFRIFVGGPGPGNVMVRLGQKGDTCVDNTASGSPYVLVSSVFDGGAYRVQPGQRVTFQHGSLHEVVDNEKESCGCPPPVPEGNEFPLAQSEGLAPAPKVASEAVNPEAQKQVQDVPPLVYQAPDHSQQASAAPPPAQPAAQTTPQKKPGIWSRVGHFFRTIFGAE
jgi:hypothetical protein